MGNRSGFLSRIRDRAERMRKNALSDEAIELHSNTLALISGCLKISEYSDTALEMAFRDHNVRITGRDLAPESLINGEMALTGTIYEVKYVDNKQVDR